MTPIVRSIPLADANGVIARLHRHAGPLRAHVLSLGLLDGAGGIAGAVILGRPVSRILDDGLTLEVSRLATDGARNACSRLLGAAAREAWRLGACRLTTYTLATEGGASLRAAGWRREAFDVDVSIVMTSGGRGFAFRDVPFPPRSWNSPGRPRVDRPSAERWRWVRFNPSIWRERNWPSHLGEGPAFHMGLAAHRAGARLSSNPFRTEDAVLAEVGGVDPWSDWREGWRYADLAPGLDLTIPPPPAVAWRAKATAHHPSSC